MVANHVRDVLAEHKAVLQTFLSDDTYRSAMIMIWTASYGGALHAPVTPFYYLEMGADEMDIGLFGVIGSCGMLIAPFYGWLLDKHGSYPVMIFNCLLCATGCLLRGVAPTLKMVLCGVLLLGLGGGNLWNTTLSHIVRHTPENRRSAHISAFLFQVGVLRLLGKSMYPIWDTLLRICGLNNQLMRFRVHMGVCTVFCFYGIFILYRSRAALSKTDLCPTVYEKTSDIGEDEDDANACEDPDERNNNQREPESNKVGIVITSVGMACQALVSMVMGTLWPLFLHDQYDWGALEYSYVLFINSVFMTLAVACAPRLEVHVGFIPSAIALCFVSGICVSMAFGSPVLFGNEWMGRVIHILFFVLGSSFIACLEPICKVIGSLFALPTSQARAMSALAISGGIGEMIGSASGTFLYKKYSKHPNGGVLPAILLIVVLTISVFLFATLSLPTKQPKSSSEAVDVGNLPTGFDAPSGGMSQLRHLPSKNNINELDS